jgi:hypothetical protein
MANGIVASFVTAEIRLILSDRIKRTFARDAQLWNLDIQEMSFDAQLTTWNCKTNPQLKPNSQSHIRQ